MSQPCALLAARKAKATTFLGARSTERRSGYLSRCTDLIGQRYRGGRRTLTSCGLPLNLDGSRQVTGHLKQPPTYPSRCQRLNQHSTANKSVPASRFPTVKHMSVRTAQDSLPGPCHTYVGNTVPVTRTQVVQDCDGLHSRLPAKHLA
jgi:hypothetical protein